MTIATLRSLVAALTFLGVWLTPARSPAQVPAHLDIVSAEIVEPNTPNLRRVTGRKVAIRIQVKGMPDCSGRPGDLAYGILVDADKDADTGFRSRRAYGTLGVDARVIAICDVVTDKLVSLIGSVTTRREKGNTVIEILTTVDRLPSVDFDWIAYASESGRMVRLPSGRRHSSWTILERALW